MVLCDLCRELLMMEKAKKATDVGLEPTASALGGLRATIAPTGQLLVVEELDFFVQYIPQRKQLCKEPHEASSSILTVIVPSKISRPSSALDIRTFHYCIKEKKQTSSLRVLLTTIKEHIESYIDID
jgi:hypothetical protein